MRATKKTAALPEAKVCRFELNPERGWYVKTSGPAGFTKVPDELKVEETRRPDIIQSKTIIRSHQRGGRSEFFTGLLPTKFPGLYFGDVYEFRNGKKVNSFCLFSFSEGNRGLTIHFFNQYKVYPPRRAKFIADYLRTVQR